VSATGGGAAIAPPAGLYSSSPSASAPAHGRGAFGGGGGRGGGPPFRGGGGRGRGRGRHHLQNASTGGGSFVSSYAGPYGGSLALQNAICAAAAAASSPLLSVTYAGGCFELRVAGADGTPTQQQQNHHQQQQQAPRFSAAWLEAASRWAEAAAEAQRRAREEWKREHGEEVGGAALAAAAEAEEPRPEEEAAEEQAEQEEERGDGIGSNDGGDEGADQDENEDDGDDDEDLSLAAHLAGKLTLGGGPSSSSSAPAASPAEAAATAAAAPAGPPGRPPKPPPDGPLPVSLRLERQALTDAELELVAAWANGLSSPSLPADATTETNGNDGNARPALIRVLKLWLFDNDLGDKGVSEAARLGLFSDPGLQEVHLSHNGLTAAGALAVLEAVADAAAASSASAPTPRRRCRPLWLRLEWNRIDEARVREHISGALRTKGLDAEVGEEVPAEERGGASWSHEKNIRFPKRPAGAAPADVQLPWLHCQRQSPREAAVLRAAKASAAASASASAAGAASERPRPGVAPAATATPAAPAAAAPPPPPPPAAPSGGHRYRPGPLLLMPDTSALLAMLGANQPAASANAHHPPQLPALTFDRLLSLASERRFGRHLPSADDRTFIVVADSVAKQLDGLKRDPRTASACRRFFGAVLDRAGPGGADFCTLLGAHEGEGLVAEQSAGVTKAKSVAEKGQRVDASLVETALFFSREIAAAGGATTDEQQHEHQLPSVPVILLSSDNGQIALAKAHGLPVLRASSPQDPADRALRALLATPSSNASAVLPAITSAALREALAPLATAGVAQETAPLRSLQAELDGAAALLGAAVAAYGDCVAVLGRVAEAAAAASASSGDGDGDPKAALGAVRRLLAEWKHEPGLFEDEDEAESGHTPSSSSLAVARRAVDALRQKSAALGSLVRTTQAPSRVMRWASGLGAGSAATASAASAGSNGE
jgi:hypothetical protein